MTDESLDMHDDDVQNDVGEEKEDITESGQATASNTDEAVISASSKARQQLRRSMEDDVAAFLARGGKIQQVEDNVMADPPRKPQSSYGSRPI